MFLTSIRLNPSRRETRKLLASPQAMHAAVLCGFPPDSDDGDGRVLWRLDRGAAYDLTLWVSSPRRPDYRGMVELASWPEAPGAWRSADTQPFLRQLSTGQCWRFRVTANPTTAIARADKSRGRVTAVKNSEHVDWFIGKAQKHGFEIGDNSLGVPNLAVSQQRTLRFERHTGGQRRTVTLITATFDGVLQVTEPMELRTVLTKGLGRARGYGCGLMTMAPCEQDR